MDTYFQLVLPDTQKKIRTTFGFHGNHIKYSQFWGKNGLMISQKLNVKPPYNNRLLLGN